MAARAPVLLFDGECNLCNGAVRFVKRRAPSDRFRFASLQSPEGQALLERFEVSHQTLDTVVLIDGDRIHLRSDAALQVVRRLRGVWPLLYVLVLLPRALRDRLYDFVARRRRAWFGSTAACPVPSRPSATQGRLE